EILRGRLQLKRIEAMQRRMKEDRDREILVKVPMIQCMKEDPGRSEFRHEVIHRLYGHGRDLPKEVVEAIHALPREHAIDDLVKVIDDAIARGPWLLRSEWKDEFTWFPLHALYLL